MEGSKGEEGVRSKIPDPIIVSVTSGPDAAASAPQPATDKPPKRKKRRRNTPFSVTVPSKAALRKRKELRRKADKERQALRRANMTEEEKEKARLKARTYKQLCRATTIKGTEEGDQQALLTYLKGQIRNKIKMALETPADREKRLAKDREDRKSTGKKTWYQIVETPEERKLREILVREAFAVEVGVENDMKQFEMLKENRLKKMREKRKIESTPKPKYPKKMSRAEREMHSFWEHDSEWDGLLSSEDEDQEEGSRTEYIDVISSDEDDKKGPEESVEEWAVRVSDIFNARIQRSQPEQRATRSTSKHSPATTTKNSNVAQGPEENLDQGVECALQSKEDLISAVSAEKAERVVLVEAEIAERRAALSGETEAERKARIELMFEDAKKARVQAKENWRKRVETLQRRKLEADNPSKEKTSKERLPPKKRSEMTDEEIKEFNKEKAAYMRERCDLLKAEWETWVGLRDASAPPGMTGVASEVTGSVNAQGALAWLQENMENHRWGIEKGASVRMGKTVPEPVKKYRLSLATMIDKDEKRSGPNAKKVAETTLIQLLTTERNVFEEFFYNRRTYVQRMATKWQGKMGLEKKAERKAMLNQKLREVYKAKRLAEGKSYAPETRGQSLIKDKDTLLKEMTGEIPRSTRGITKNHSRCRQANPVVRDGRVLPVSGVRFNKPPGQREYSHDEGKAFCGRAQRKSSVSAPANNNNTSIDQPDAPATQLTPVVPTLVPVSIPSSPTKRPSRAKRKSKTREETPPPPSPPSPPPQEDSDSDWAGPADVDESLFDDDDSRGGGSIEESATPPAPYGAWNNINTPPTLEPFSTLSHSHTQCLFPHASYFGGPSSQTCQTFPPPIDLGHGLLLGNPVPSYPTTQIPQQHTQHHYNQEASPYSSVEGQGYTQSYASSACSDDPEPPALSREDSADSDYTMFTHDTPPQKKRRGRPPSSSGGSTVTRLKKIRRSRTREKRIVDQALLRPEITFSEGKVPIVTHPLLLSNPAEKSGETNEKADAESEPLHVPIEKAADPVKCPKCPEEFEDEQKMKCHKDEKRSKVSNGKEDKVRVVKREQREDVEEKEEDDLEEEVEQKKGKKRVLHEVSLNCPVCNLVVRGGNVFTNHLWTVHWKDERKTDLGSCPICLRSLKGQGARFFFYLARHIKAYHADIKKDSFFPGFKTPDKLKGVSYNNFYCVICSSNFPAYLPLAKHIEYDHSRACPICGIILQVSDHLRDHVEMFHPQENYMSQEVLSQEQLKDQVRCVRCLSKFVNASFLKSHEKDCQEEKEVSSFKCWWSCANSKLEKFQTYEALEKHHEECHSEDTIVPFQAYDNLHCVYKCEVCVERFYTLPFLRLHYMKGHPNAPALPEVTSLVPELVPNTRPQLNEPARKIITNVRNRQYAKSTEFPEINRNSAFHTVVPSSCKTEAPTYTCGDCSKTVNANEFCRLHRGYRKARRRCCRTCGAQYAHIESLIGHNRTKHGISAEENTRLENEYDEERLKLAAEKQEPILKCAVCLMSFVAKDFHIMHSTMGEELDPDVRWCPHCPNLSFCKAKLLDAHLELCHSDPKTAAKAAKRQEEEKQKHKDLLVQLRQKSAGKEWPCDECGAIFSLKPSLQRHKRNIHSGIGKRFQCPHCDQKSSRIEQLRNHIKLIHQLGGRPSTQKSRPPRVHIPDKKCPMCVKKFATEGALQSHIKKSHGQHTLCYACGENVEDIKAHNRVCPMGGMEEDALIRDDDEQTTATKPSWRAQKVAKLPLLALLKIALEQRDKELIRQKKAKKEVDKAGVSSEDKDAVDDETDEDDLDENQKKSTNKKHLTKTKISKRKEKSKDDYPKLKKSKERGGDRQAKKTKKTPECLEHDEPKPKEKKSREKKSHEKKSRKRTKEPSKKSNSVDKIKMSPAVEKPKTKRKIKKHYFDSDEESNANEDREWENADDHFEEEIIVVKEEVDDVDSYFEIDLADDFSIKPEETICSKHNCPCEKGKWDAIVHGDQSMIVELVRCDREVEALEKEKELRRKKAEKAIIEKEKAQQRYIERKKAEQLKKEKKAEQRKKQQERYKQRKKEREQFFNSQIEAEEIRSRAPPRVYGKPVQVVDPELIAYSMPFDVTLRSDTPPVSSSQSAGWRQFNHIAKPTVEPNDSESSDYEDDNKDPPYDPLAL